MMNMDAGRKMNEFLWLVKLSTISLHLSSDYPIKEHVSWEEERDDILERAEWLCDRIIVKLFPRVLGI